MLTPSEIMKIGRAGTECGKLDYFLTDYDCSKHTSTVFVLVDDYLYEIVTFAQTPSAHTGIGNRLGKVDDYISSLIKKGAPLPIAISCLDENGMLTRLPPIKGGGELVKEVRSALYDKAKKVDTELRKELDRIIEQRGFWKSYA